MANETAVLKENKMGTMPVGKLLISMALPMVVSMLVQALYNIVDSIFVAQINENALTAVSLAFPVQNLMIAVATGTGVGINAILSKSLGEKNFEVANKIANISIFLAFASFLAFAILGAVGSGVFFHVQTADAEIVTYGTQYLTICTVCSIGLFGQIMFERLLQSTGKTIYSMFTQGTGAIINIILDPILIFGWFGMPKMGVAGAAAATVIGQIIAMLIGLLFNIKVNHEIKLHIREMRPQANLVKRIYAIGVPSILMASLGSVMTFSLNKILMTFTSTATAVFGVYFKLQSFVFMPVFGLNNGMIPILAYNYGAKKKERIHKTIRLSVIFAMSIMLVGLIVFQMIPGLLLQMFNASPEMLKIGETALRIISICFLFAGFGIVVSSVFQALGKSIYSLLISVARQLVIIIPVAYLLSLTGNLNAVWWSIPIAEIASVVLCSLFLTRVMKQLDI
ncbi:MAG: MATE family efflux transporter [Clostridia bacterium]|nr:MATE family efflux transporter [Clostridia bacterium]